MQRRDCADARRKRRDCADARIRALHKTFGKTQQEIAAAVGCSVTHINYILSDCNRSVSKKLVGALGEVMKTAYKELFEPLIQRGLIQLVETDSNEMADSAEILRRVITTLINLFDPDPAPVDLPQGTPAVLVSLGPDVYLLKVSPQSSDEDKLRLLIHELEHMVQRRRAQLEDMVQRRRAQLPKLEETYIPKAGFWESAPTLQRPFEQQGG